MGRVGEGYLRRLRGVPVDGGQGWEMIEMLCLRADRPLGYH